MASWDFNVSWQDEFKPKDAIESLYQLMSSGEIETSEVQLNEIIKLAINGINLQKYPHNTLSLNEAIAVAGYTADSDIYLVLNDLLRSLDINCCDRERQNQTPDIAERNRKRWNLWKDIIVHLGSGWAKLTPPNGEITVYRVIGMKDEEKDVKVEDTITNYNRVGEKITWGGFSSASSSVTSAIDLFLLKKPRGILCEITALECRCVKQFSAFSLEYEVIFQPGSRFEVVKAHEIILSNNYYKVYLKQLPTLFPFLSLQMKLISEIRADSEGVSKWKKGLVQYFPKNLTDQSQFLDIFKMIQNMILDFELQEEFISVIQEVGFDTVRTGMLQFPKCEEIQEEGCRVFLYFCLPNKIDSWDLVIMAMISFPKNQVIQRKGILALCKIYQPSPTEVKHNVMTKQDQLNKQRFELKSLKEICNGKFEQIVFKTVILALENHSKNFEVQRFGCTLLAYLFMNGIGEIETALRLIETTSREFIDNSTMQEVILNALTSLLFNNKSQHVIQLFEDNKLLNTIKDIMSKHIQSVDVQKMGCIIISVLLNILPVGKLLENDIDQSVEEAINNHQQNLVLLNYGVSNLNTFTTLAGRNNLKTNICTFSIISKVMDSNIHHSNIQTIGCCIIQSIYQREKNVNYLMWIFRAMEKHPTVNYIQLIGCNSIVQYLQESNTMPGINAFKLITTAIHSSDSEEIFNSAMTALYELSKYEKNKDIWKESGAYNLVKSLKDRFPLNDVIKHAALHIYNDKQLRYEELEHSMAYYHN
eukprot:TRINITY_DN6354_c0_g1_i1.p1 TRINITY_DN6354_c0_g1~~TRINITY_DN6354_c0_g1_i1.p1  ORF type:complete len:760 (-),score=54.37 TRINITY_DN6354_c0_g1_i1:157-2436(-)